MEIRRGDLVLAALPGDYGKIRPMLVLQDDAFEAVPSVTVLPLTSDLANYPLFRLDVEADRGNGLRTHSQIMVDKAGTIKRDKIGRRIGQLDPDILLAASSALRQFLGLDE